MTPADYAPYLIALLAIWALYVLAPRWLTRTETRQLVATDFVPASLHPVIDPSLCIGCAACVHACPEGKIINLVGNKAELVDAASCIGHGACKTSCPVAAIDLVLGSATRGVDIPKLSPDFQTNVSGLYVAGELGGMGLIANAIEQGSQAVSAIAKRDDLGQPNMLDMVIVGAGPAGFAASLAAREKRLSVVTLEQDQFGGAVAHYPRDKIVMTRPANLPLYGELPARRVHKEKLLADWQEIMRQTGIQVRFGQRVEQITKQPWGFEIQTQDSKLTARTVLLAVGRRGAPKTLGVPGEDLPKVVYSLSDAAQYAGKKVIVVGGGNSAVEAALTLRTVLGTKVVLCHRGDGFSRVTQSNRAALAAVQSDRSIEILLEAAVTRIGPSTVDVTVRGEPRSIDNDAVIVCAGGQLPTALLRDAGVDIETKYGTL